MIGAIGAKPALPITEEQKKAAEIQKVASEFESIFVRQLLMQSKALGKAGDSGYGTMMVEALANSIAAGGGLGLAKQIEAAFAQQHSAPDKARQSGEPAATAPNSTKGTK